MTICFTLSRGEKFWLHAQTRAEALKQLALLRPGAHIRRIEVLDTGHVIDGPDGYRE